MSKFDYILTHRDAARTSYWQDVPAFGDTNDLLQELRIVYDWIAGEKGLDKIARRQFQAAMPEVNKKFPQLAKSFAKMDVDSNAWLEWDEFVNFCIKDEQFRTVMKRAASMEVYGVDFNGARTYKIPEDSHLGCEMSIAPPLLPWEQSHIVEWRIYGLDYSGTHRGLPVYHNGRPVSHGTSIASPAFRAAGVCGYLRFWPVSYWTEPQLRKKGAVPGFDAEKDDPSMGRCQMPAVTSWCCVGMCLPPGSHLQAHFHVGPFRSELRECFWSKGTSGGQLWAPKVAKGMPTPEEIRRIPKGEPIVVGVEIVRNKGVLHQKPVVKRVHEKHRFKTRPALKPAGSIVASIPSTSKLLGRAMSEPSLEAKTGRPATVPSMSRQGSLPGRQASERPPVFSCGLRPPCAQGCMASGAVGLLDSSPRPMTAPPSCPELSPMRQAALDAELLKAKAMLLDSGFGIPANSIDDRLASIRRTFLSRSQVS